MPEIKQHYCSTTWGQVCYWLTSNLSIISLASSLNSAKIKLVLFLHGVGGSGRYWFSYLEELALSPDRIIALAPDLLGFGASNKPNIEYTQEVHLEVIEEVLNDILSQLPSDHPDLIEIELVGHSMGGILALLLATDLLNKETALKKGEQFRLTKLALLGTPYASPKHNLKREVLRSPLNRAMLGHPLVCQIVHHSLKLLWPLILFLIGKGWIKQALPLPVIADYMQHTCQSYTSSAHHLIFETNLDPVLELLQPASAGLFQTLLVYSKADDEVPWQHGQELAGWFHSNQLKLLEEGSHQLLGQLALNIVLNFLS